MAVLELVHQQSAGGGDRHRRGAVFYVAGRVRLCQVPLPGQPGVVHHPAWLNDDSLPVDPDSAVYHHEPAQLDEFLCRVDYPVYGPGAWDFPDAAVYVVVSVGADGIRAD